MKTEISGQMVIDLCEAIGVDHTQVHNIQITPQKVIVSTWRSTPSGQIIIAGAPDRDALVQTTEVGIRWAATGA